MRRASQHFKRTVVRARALAANVAAAKKPVLVINSLLISLNRLSVV
jgi:hypothetical protein